MPEKMRAVVLKGDYDVKLSFFFSDSKSFQ